MPSARSRSRHGKRTPDGSQPLARSWSDTTSKMLGRVAVIACQTARVDERPPIWIGHVVMHSTDVTRAAAFWQAVGMRPVYADSDMAILELRGGTHLLVFPGGTPPPDGTDAPFDLMVDDLDATHAEWSARGLDPSAIRDGLPGDHTAFTVRDPDGYVLSVYSNHTMGPV